MIKQCAWCKSLIMNGVRIKKSPEIISGMSHGICLNCKQEIEMDYYKEKTLISGSSLAVASII